MLRYVGYGQRDWCMSPMPAHRRVNWEFLATLQGNASPTVEPGHVPVMRGPTLWLFPPEISHGWVSDDPAGAEAAIFHFSGMDPLLEKVVRQQGWLSMSLDSEDIETIRELAQELWSHYWKPTLLGDLHASRALSTLCLLALRDHPDCQRPAAPRADIATVETAERWILDHIGDGRAISEAASAAGVSRPQLYRLIQQVRGCSPRCLLLQLRLKAAKQLMAGSRLKLHAVAIECGFSNASSFCRAFRATHGCSPARWRDEYQVLHRQPKATESHDPNAHRYPAAPVHILDPRDNSAPAPARGRNAVLAG